MGRPRKHPRKWYVATDTGVVEEDGVPYHFKRNETRVPEGHYLLKAVPHVFRELDAEGPPNIESATAAPGEVRGD
jgi:hypothetical protein